MSSPPVSGRRSARRVLVACRPYDLSEAPFDGFVARHRRIVATIAREHHVTLLCLRPSSDQSPAPSVPGVESVLELELATVNYAATRGARLASALRSALAMESRADQEIARAAAMARADVAVTIGPFLGPEYRALFSRVPTLHLFEEDLGGMAEIASQSWRGRSFRRGEEWLHSRTRAQPAIVVSISRRELGTAARRYPRARQLYLPFTLPHAQWPRCATPSEGDCVLLAGNLWEPRNAEGGALLLAELAGRGDLPAIRVRIVSDAGLHPLLEPFVAESWVEHRRPAGPLREHYRESWAALVPALRVSGQKTTILQAWACGCPVVCSAAAAATVDAPDAVLAGRTPPEIVDALASLAGSPDRCRQLVRAGLAALAQDFDPEIEDERVLRAIVELQAR